MFKTCDRPTTVRELSVEMFHSSVMYLIIVFHSFCGVTLIFGPIYKYKSNETAKIIAQNRKLFSN